MHVIRRGDAPNAGGDRVVLVHWFDQGRRVWMFDDVLRPTRSRRAFRLVRALNGRRGRAECKRL